MQTLYTHSQYLAHSFRAHCLFSLFLRACIALAPLPLDFLLALRFALVFSFVFLADLFFWCSFLDDLMMDA